MGPSDMCLFCAFPNGFAANLLALNVFKLPFFSGFFLMPLLKSTISTHVKLLMYIEFRKTICKPLTPKVVHFSHAMHDRKNDYLLT
jgi:hypothetical protein